MLGNGLLLTHAAASLERETPVFLIAAFMGMAAGVALGWWNTASELLQPIIEALRPIPPIAWTPLAILWFGIGNAPSYFLVFVGAVFPVFVNTFAAVRGLDRTSTPRSVSGPAPGSCLPTWSSRHRCRSSSPGCG